MRIISVLTVFLSATAFAQLPERARAFLEAADSAPFAGSPSVAIVASPSVGLVDLGLTDEKLQTQVELILRRNGIAVHSFFGKHPENSGWLLISAAVKPSTAGHYSYSIQVTYNESVLLRRQLQAKTNTELMTNGTEAPLWNRNEFGDADASSVVKTVSNACEDIFNQFALAYLRANPRQ